LFKYVKIEGLQGNNMLVQDTQGILKIAANFYKNLFREESMGHFCLDRELWIHDEVVSDRENAVLEAPFSEEEVRAAIFSSYAEGGPCPNGL
jgi:hypothetical protein